ncbi:MULTISPECIES: MucR family transcriptional regulator [unclassified Mesorhizobium]|uniref:MucR family transcriptional regulator n=1 Tax=unclassified Mesorhizobium TaxID=325217 RepID=UPI001129FCC4|nr:MULTISPECIES: MucR family transcriptional regulator [unclassified Mesorhizobium]MBZ9898318.1 MucR family transcriptional regulator [Mesorhizobium sp. BR1-1-6]TPM57405.1 transcriptional regulator [Mesorhizobium sp. B2-2-4]TPM65791.1 transcriptional regulator [Mesorhizobium sp. B2-2-1]TPN30478.1 transcriptional regulator [Mesorhizobium sp. B1-1-6]TPN72117.1 transcriptional regulator [Mesorhizobium sp. B1-1-3]
MAADVVAAYVSNNPVPVSELPSLIVSVHRALSDLSGPVAAAAAELLPAVNPTRSVTPDFIICVDDGKKFKSLKRHLRQLGMTADEYRPKRNLPADYPMVAPNYAATRSALAKASGLGRKPVPQKKAPAKRTAKVA